LIAFQVKDDKILKEADVEKVTDVIIRNVEFLKLFKCLDSLSLLKFATVNVEYLDVLKSSPQVTEGFYN